MVLHLAGRGGVTISPELRRRIAGKMAKMERLFPKLIEARVVLATERYRHRAEVTLRAKRATFHAEGAAPDFHAAMDQALAVLSAQIRRKKERVTAKERPATIAGPVRAAGLSEPVDEAPSGGPVVVRRTSVKPMSLEEADRPAAPADGRPARLPERADAAP